MGRRDRLYTGYLSCDVQFTSAAAGREGTNVSLHKIDRKQNVTKEQTCILHVENRRETIMEILASRFSTLN